PGFRLFQIPVRMLLPAAFPAAFLCGAGVDSLMRSTQGARAARKILLLVFAAAFLLNVLSWPNPFAKPPAGERNNWTIQSWYMYLIYWAGELVCLALAYAALRTDKDRLNAGSGGLLLFCLIIESWLLARPHVEVRPQNLIYPSNPVLE